MFLLILSCLPPDRPVRLEVGGSYASLEKKTIFDRSQFKKLDSGAPPRPPELASFTE